MAFVPLTLSHTGMSAITINAYWCEKCYYEYAPLGGMINHHLYKMIGDRMFRWSYEETTDVARIWYIGSPGIPGVSPNKDLKLLKTFEEHFPMVTPDNVEEKLKLVVTFL